MKATKFRTNYACADLVRDAYLGRDVIDSAEPFSSSGKFAEVVQLIGHRIQDATVYKYFIGS